MDAESPKTNGTHDSTHELVHRESSVVDMNLYGGTNNTAYLLDIAESPRTDIEVSGSPKFDADSLDDVHQPIRPVIVADSSKSNGSDCAEIFETFFTNDSVPAAAETQVISQATSTADLFEFQPISRGTSVSELRILDEMLSDTTIKTLPSSGTSSDDLLLTVSRSTSMTDIRLERPQKMITSDDLLSTISRSTSMTEILLEKSQMITSDDILSTISRSTSMTDILLEKSQMMNSDDRLPTLSKATSMTDICLLSSEKLEVSPEPITVPQGFKDRSICIVAPLQVTPPPQNESTQTEADLPALLRLIRDVVSSPSSLEDRLPEIRSLLPAEVTAQDENIPRFESPAVSAEDGYQFSISEDGGGVALSASVEPLEPKSSPPSDPICSLASWKRMQVSIGSAFSAGLLIPSFSPVQALLAPLGIVICVPQPAPHPPTLKLSKPDCETPWKFHIQDQMWRCIEVQCRLKQLSRILVSDGSLCEL